MDSIGCAIQALDYSACKKVLGPFYDNGCENGVRVPGTTFSLNPIEGAFNIATMIRWLDFNDTWLAKEWGHPSDNLGAILALTDWISQREKKFAAISILDNLIKAHEIQGVIALENSFNAVGLDHVILVKLASTAVGANILGLPMQQRLNSISHVFWMETHSEHIGTFQIQVRENHGQRRCLGPLCISKFIIFER